MKKLLMTAAACLVLATPARAEKTITVPDNFRETLLNVQGVLERCIGAVTINGDKATCGALQNFIAQLASQPLTDVPKPAPSPSPTPSPTPEPQKQ